MIFVSMTSDELLARTAQYQIQYSSARRRRRNRRTGLQPSQEYLTAFRSPLQSLERTVISGPGSTFALDDNESAENDHQAEFRVTTQYEDSEDNVFIEREEDGEPSVAELEHIEGEDDFVRSDSEDSESEVEAEDEDGDDDNEDTAQRRSELQRRAGPIRRQYSDPTSSRRQPGPGDPSPAATASGSGELSNTEVLKPHARFFIERGKSMVSIKFDPPPYAAVSCSARSHTDPSSSGRFILIKLWSPRSDGNIDIQSILAHGYAGPRFFPSGGFR